MYIFSDRFWFSKKVNKCLNSSKNKWLFCIKGLKLVASDGERFSENTRVKSREINTDRRHSAFERLELQSVSDFFFTNLIHKKYNWYYTVIFYLQRSRSISPRRLIKQVALESPSDDVFVKSVSMYFILLFLI